MSKKANYYNQVVHLLQDLHKLYPTYNIGRHLSTALADYGDVWGIPDKEVAYALQKYKAQLEMDVPHEEDLDKIIQDGMDLDRMFREEEENY